MIWTCSGFCVSDGQIQHSTRLFSICTLILVNNNFHTWTTFRLIRTCSRFRRSVRTYFGLNRTLSGVKDLVRTSFRLDPTTFYVHLEENYFRFLIPDKSQMKSDSVGSRHLLSGWFSDITKQIPHYFRTIFGLNRISFREKSLMGLIPDMFGPISESETCP